MIAAPALPARDEQTVRWLKQRDRKALLVYAVSGVIVIMAGETAAFHLDLADRFGMVPLLARGLAYLLLSTLLWAMLLNANRRLVMGLMREKQQGYESVLLAYDSALGLKDSYTGGHGRRVAFYAFHLATVMGLPEAEARSIQEAALLHDLGKIGIPDAILTKPAKLTPEEFMRIQEHSLLGAGILESIPLLKRHVPAVRHHHERFDGSGYPDGLRGGDIPLGARIIAVADVLDALLSDRSYRQSLPLDAAVTEISGLSGRKFDPEVVAAAVSAPFLRILKQTFPRHPCPETGGLMP